MKCCCFIWDFEVSLVSRTQPSSPLCLWQCFFSQMECTNKVVMHNSNLTLDSYSLLTDFSIWALKKGYKEGRKWGPSALYWTILESYGHHAFIALFYFVSNSNSQNNENCKNIRICEAFFDELNRTLQWRKWKLLGKD